jgi:hypothetical protein
MDYANAITKFIATNLSVGNDALPLNVIIEANAADKLAPGELDVNGNGQLTWKGRTLSGPASDFPMILNAPGFWLGSLISDGSTPFVVSPSSFPSSLRTAFTYSAIASLIGSGAKGYLDAIIALHRDKLKPSGLLPADELDRVIMLCTAGVVCVPATSSTLNNLYRTLPDLPREPVFGDSLQSKGLSAWAGVIGAYDDSRKAYLNHAYDTARDLATAAANNAERWDKIYSAVEAVRDAPGAAAAYVGGAVVDTITGNLGSFLTGKVVVLLALAAAGVGGYFYFQKHGAAALKKIVKG